MPKETFNNLSEDKKRKIFEAAVKEFSSRRFSEASINQIVKNAEIPRGSFYQYFNDKEDIYLYMYEQIGKEKREIGLHSEIVDRSADIFEVCMQTTKATFEWARHNPEYMRISTFLEIDDSEFITKLRADTLEKFAELIERDKERGLIKQDVDSRFVADMIYTLIWKQGSHFISDEETFFKRLAEGLGIIRDGIGK